MTTSSTRRVTVTAVDVEDATAYLRIEGGGKFDVSISGTYAGTVVLEYRTPPAGNVRIRKTYTVDTEFEEMLEVGSEMDVRLRLSADTSGTSVLEISTRTGKQR